MAESNAGGLSLRIGLTLSQLQSDFLAAEQTVRQGIAALNRQQNIVKIKMETDITGLDSVADKTKILEIQERSLTRLLEMQRDKLKLATAAYNDYVKSKGTNATVTKNAEAAMERERLALAKLEAQLKSLSAQKISIDTLQLRDSIAKINAKIQNVRIKAEIDTSKLQGTNAVFDAQKIHIAAVTKELELQKQKLVQLREEMRRSAQLTGKGSVQTLNIKSNVLQQIQEVNQLETRLKALSNTKIDLQIRADSLKQTEAQIQERIARLNARLENIRVKTDLDVSKLSSAASEFDRAKIHVQGLTHELELQKQKLNELRKSFATSVSTNGLNNVKTINLDTDIQRQIQEINQLKAKIQELNNIAPPKTNNVLSGYLNIKGDVSGKLQEITNAFNQLKGATSSADSAITATLGVIGEIPHPVGRAVAALVSLPIIFMGIENSIVDMTKAVASAGDSVYVTSRGFQMSFADTGKFVTNAKVAGVEVQDLAMTVKRVQQQIVKGGDDSRAAEWLKRYGESAYDASGHLKNLNEMTFALSRALKKAQEDGKGMDFVLSVFRNVSADAITAIEDIEAVNEQASTIVKNGLANPALAHEVQGNINAMNVQAGQMNAAFSSALLPVANEIIPKITERMGKMTQLIADNKEVIREFGHIAAEAFMKMEEAAEVVVGTVASIGKFFYELKKKPKHDEFIERFKFDFDIKSIDDFIKKVQPKAYDVIKNNSLLYAQVKAQYEPIFRAITDAQAEIKAKQKELEKLLEQPLSIANFSTIGQERNRLDDEEYLKALRNARKYQEEADAISSNMNQSDYENKRFELEQWRTNLLRETELSAQEREAIQILYAAKSVQIEQERADTIAEIHKSVDSEFKTSLQNRLDKIEEEKQAWVEAGMEESEAAELAQKRIDKAMEDAAEKAQQYLKDAADIEYEMTHTAFEKQLRDIEQWEEAQRKKADTAEEVAAIIKNSAAKEAEAFEREVDRIKGKIQTLEDKIFEQEHSQYENDLRKLQQERLNYYEDGVYPSELIERYYNNAVNVLRNRAEESRKSGGDYTNTPDGVMQYGGNGIMVIEGDQIIDDGLIRGQQQEISLMTNENRIRAQLMQGMTAEQRARIEENQARQESANAQRQLTQAIQQVASGFQIIEGDNLVAPSPQLPQQSTNGYQIIEGDQVIAMPTAELQQFGNTIQQTRAELEQSNPFQPLTDTQALLVESTRGLTDAQNSLHTVMNDLPPEYFRNLADSAKSVSEMQFALTESTMKLIDAQEALKNALLNLPTGQSSDREATDRSDRYLSLATSTREVEDAQDLLARTTREVNGRLSQISDIPLQRRDTQRDSGWKLGFDYDTAKDIMLTGVGLAAASASTGIGIAVSPEILAGSVAAALGGGFIKGSYDATTATPQENFSAVNVDLSALQTVLENIDTSVQGIRDDIKAYSSEKQPELQEIPMPEWLSQPLNVLDTPLSNILQELQNVKVENAEVEGSETYESVNLQQLFGTLPNIEMSVQNILQELQTQGTSETTLSFETIVTPLEHIAGIGQNILSVLSMLKDTMGRQQPPQITVSPSNSINLGGAYVFDNAMKTQLVNDITSTIVEKITATVQQATSSNYGYGV